MVSSSTRGRKLSVIKISPSGHLLSVLLFSACIDWNASGREWAKVITLKPIKVVSVPEIAGGYSQGMCLDVLFSLTYLVNLRESPNGPVEKPTKDFPVAKHAHFVVCVVCSEQNH